MSCTRCGSEQLYQFEASATVKVSAPLPLVCRQCGQISVGGVPVNLPEAMEKQALGLAEAAMATGHETRLALEADDQKELRIEKYFANVYQQGYLDGFFRCLAFYQHQAKEGRLIRLRALWNDFMKHGLTPDGEQVVLRTPKASYTEFEQLLSLSAAPEKPNAKTPSNQHQPDEKRTP